jgi:hypothetical protein
MPFGRLPRMPNPLVAALNSIAVRLDRLEVGLDRAGDRLDRLGTRTRHLKEYMVANFDALNDKVDGLGDAIAAAVTRIDADFQALRDQLASDATDQAAVDAAADKLQASIDALNSVDPDPSNPAPPAEPII